MRKRRSALRGGATLLLVLLTLLCALFPLGLPASQKLGSAFNPANEIVTVRSERVTIAARANAEAPDPREPATLVVAAPPALSEAELPEPTTLFAPPHTAARPDTDLIREPFAPRAPPHAA